MHVKNPVMEQKANVPFQEKFNFILSKKFTTKKIVFCVKE